MENYDDYKIDYYFDPEKINRETYYLNGKYHRLDGPAYISYWKSGGIAHKTYYLNATIHRIDGPANIWYYKNGHVECEGYYWNGQRLLIDAFIETMRESNNKTETLLEALNESLKYNRAATTIIINMFRNDIDQNVINNLELFI